MAHASAPLGSATSSSWDTTYEWKTVALLGVGFGLVGLDRWIIASLFPAMALDLGLPEGEIGRLAGILGILWGVFAIFSGRLSDSIGHRKVLIPAIVLFSLMSGFSGLVQGLVTLVWIRAIMGAMEGTYCPTSFTAVAAASKPERRGFNQGLQQSGFALMGFALGPIIATQLLNVVPSWRWVFWICAIPGFIVGVLLYFHLREPKDTQAGALIGATQASGSWLDVLKTPNIVVCMVALLCAMACVFVLGAMVPVYLTNALQLAPTDVGLVASALGFGGFFGQFGWPGLSDRFGRKPLAILGFIGATLSVWWFASIEAAVLPLFIALFVCSFFCLGNVALITGPIATESAPRGLISAAIGVVVGAGEIFGGGVAPIIAGNVTDRYGLPSSLNVALIGVALGIFVCFFLRETAPSKTAVAVRLPA
ncbi:MAG TPA: MFS transporter [Gammaproteobacteria bacterium]|nr:MFS transporter [Gammaproteobacteria bacterium]